jgi:hypothetical protein
MEIYSYTKASGDTVMTLTSQSLISVNFGICTGKQSSAATFSNNVAVFTTPDEGPEAGQIILIGK